MPTYRITEDGRKVWAGEADSLSGAAAKIMAAQTAGKKRVLSPEAREKKRAVLAASRAKRWAKK
jgi:hypothetical protein